MPEPEKSGFLEMFGGNLSPLRLLLVPVLVGMAFGIFALVYHTGGVRVVYSHSMYIPILLAGFTFGLPGGVLAGLLGGILLGPFMPVDTVSGEMQTTLNWIYRTGLFVLIGGLSGIASNRVKSYIGKLKWHSLHESSTGLPNRRALLEYLSGRKGGKPVTLAVASVENMMKLKSAFGSGAVEESVRQLAERLEKKRPGRRIYHVSTSHAGVLAEGLAARGLQGEVAEASGEPVICKGLPLHIDIRAGAADFAGGGARPEDILRSAEAALTSAQEEKRGYVSFSPETAENTEENLLILGELRDAVWGGEISMHYQPKVLISTGEVCGMEALLRWRHPEKGDIPPARFVPRAEQSTLISLLTEFSLESALAQTSSWNGRGITFPSAVNISVRNFSRPGFSETVLSLLRKYGIGGEQLELEVTEGALMSDAGSTISELERLASLSIVISIDDFGTSYSSLQYLHRLPVSQIKIDRSFIANLPSDRDTAHIVESAVLLARKMGLKTVAEGVESKEVYDYLGGIGCDMVQGFLISPALSPDDFERWLERWKFRPGTGLRF